MKVVFASSFLAVVVLAAGAPAGSGEAAKDDNLIASAEQTQNRVRRSDYGPPPSPPSYDHPSMSSYDHPPSMPSYDHPPPSYGHAPSMPSYDHPPPSYGHAPSMPLYGHPPIMPSYGHPPSMPSYGHPSYAAPPSPPSYGPAPTTYVAPCGGAPVSYYHPAPAQPSYGYGAPHGYAPHYRSDEFGDADFMTFPDNDLAMSAHMPSARFNYGIPITPVAPVAASSHLGSGSTTFSGIGSSGLGIGSTVAGIGSTSSGIGLTAAGVGSAGTMPAFSVFPTANAGGCSVPLLLSCSPSITSGRMIKGYAEAPQVATGASSSSSATVIAGGNAYRGVEQAQQDTHESAEQQTHSKLDSTKDSMHSNNK